MTRHALRPNVSTGKVVNMNRTLHDKPQLGPKGVALLIVALVALAVPRCAAADPSPAAVATFNQYVAQVEDRLARQHNSADEFLASFDAARVRRGEVVIEQLTPEASANPPGAMLHHWRGTAFVPHARAADLVRLLSNFADYPKIYSPQITSARVTPGNDGHFETTLRVVQKHVITVVLDTSYDVQFYSSGDEGSELHTRGYSTSHSTRIAEIASPGTANERALDASHEHGFLWRLDTWWRWEERDGGVYMQIESVSLTRAVPTGLGWAIGPYIQSIPRESLEFTLKATANSLKK
jgi:hypothetical protein